MSNKYFWPFLIVLTLVIGAFVGYQRTTHTIRRSEVINGVTCTYECWEKLFGGAAQVLVEECGERREVIRQELDSFPSDVLKINDSADYRFIRIGYSEIEYQSERVSRLKVPTVIPRGWMGAIMQPIDALKDATKELTSKKRQLLGRPETNSLSER